MTKLEYAQLFRMMGIAVIPLMHRNKLPASHMMGGTWEKYKTLLPTEYDVRNWLYSDWMNYGVIAGWNDLAILDFDDADSFDIWSGFFEIYLKHKVFETPFMVKTSRGAHVYLTMPAGGNNSKRRGVDVKFHGYVVGPMSTHPSGAIYQPINGNMVFPQVFDLETILPSELFPPVVAGATIKPQIEMVFTPLTTEYDPFAAASNTVADIDLITKVKQSVRIENFFTDCVRTSVDGRWLACRCPFHDDERPSFWIDVKRQLCGCQVCGMLPMDAINLYSRMHNVTESVAVSAMAAECGVWR